MGRATPQVSPVWSHRLRSERSKSFLRTYNIRAGYPCKGARPLLCWIAIMKRLLNSLVGLILLPLYFAQLGFTQTSDELKALKKGLLLP